MKTTIEQYPAINRNPVISVSKDGTVLYANESCKELLHVLCTKIGDKLPPSITEIVQRVISLNSPEKTEVDAGDRVLLVVFAPIPEQECVSISGFDISDRKDLDEKVQESEIQENSKMELSEIIDIKAIQPLMEELYKLTHIPIGINDLKGNVLVSVGWQDICTKFHRVHPETLKHCIESDKKLSSGVLPNEFKLYKCKNNMWDIVTPIMVGSQHVGYVFSGQFFFDDEPLDYELFLSQARKYGFNEEEYIAALKKVPRLNRKTVETGMTFFMTFANMLSQLSYSNTKLTHSLAKRDELVDTLLESEKRERARSNELAVVLDAVPAAVLITHDLQALQMNGNHLAYEWFRLPEGSNISKASPEGERPENYRTFKDGVEIPLADMPVRMAASGKDVRDYEFDLVFHDGTIRHLLGNAKPLSDEQGNIHGAVSAFIDITERKKAEEALKKLHDNLERLVEERTSQLEKAYSSLKESEEKYRNIVETAIEGIVIVDAEFRATYINKRMEELLGYKQEEISGKSTLDFTDEEGKAITNLKQNRVSQDTNVTCELKLKRKDGSSLWVLVSSKSIFDKDGNFAGALSMLTDITERKKAEESLAIIETARKQEVHHRVKNNLQVISSLLDLQADKFKGKKIVEESEVLEAFKESQDRVISMALIHEELHKSGEIDTLNFSQYIEELADNLFLTYRSGNNCISLDTDIEEDIFFDMDLSVPLGIIVNELVSNSLKYAFVDRDKGEIRIRLHRDETGICNSEDYSTAYVLSISDNGVGIPENIDIEDLDSLGLKLVTTLVDQLDGELELKRNNGTEFTIRFKAKENQAYAQAPKLVDIE